MQKPQSPFPPAQKPVAVIGYSGHALVVIDALLSQGREVVAYCEPGEISDNPHQLAYFGSESDTAVLEKLKTCDYLVAVGCNKTRRKISEFLNQQLSPATRAVHSTAVISGLAKLGAGVFIGPLAVVNARALLGQGVVCNSSAVVEHDCTIGDFAHIGPGAVLAGEVKIGRNTLVGANAVVRPGIIIGENVIIGAGSVVVANISDNFSVAGNPARPIEQKPAIQT